MMNQFWKRDFRQSQSFFKDLFLEKFSKEEKLLKFALKTDFGSQESIEFSISQFIEMSNASLFELPSTISGVAEMILKYSNNEFELFDFFHDANQVYDYKYSNIFIIKIYALLS